MQCEQAAEDLGALGKSLQRAILQLRVPVQGEHQSRHQERPESQSVVSFLIGCKIAGCKALRQRDRLAEGQTESLPGDRIHRAGSVSDKSDIAAPHGPQTAVARNRAPLRRNRFCFLQLSVQPRQVSQAVFQAQVWIVRSERHTDLIFTHRSRKPLAVLTPVDFHEIRPGCGAVVASKRVSQPRPVRSLQSGPAAYS